MCVCVCVCVCVCARAQFTACQCICVDEASFLIVHIFCPGQVEFCFIACLWWVCVCVCVWQQIAYNCCSVCLAVSCWCKWERWGRREGIIPLYLFLQPTGTSFSLLAGEHTQAHTHTQHKQTHCPTNHEIVMSDLLMPLDSGYCIPVWSCTFHINTHIHTHACAHTHAHTHSHAHTRTGNKQRAISLSLTGMFYSVVACRFFAVFTDIYNRPCECSFPQNTVVFEWMKYFMKFIFRMQSLHANSQTLCPV